MDSKNERLSQRDYEFGLVIEFMVSTGLRLGEVSALNWQDLQRSTNTRTGNIIWFIHVNKTRYYKNKVVQDKAKAGSNGSVPISPSLVEKLEARKTTAHSLRHSSVTFLASNGHDLQHVQKFVRHTSVNMTRAYFAASHLNMEGMAGTMDKLFIPTKKLG